MDGDEESGVRRLDEPSRRSRSRRLPGRGSRGPGAGPPRAEEPAPARRGRTARTATPRRPRRDGAPRRRAASVDVPVAARAEVAGRVERLAAERAGRPSGRDRPEGAFGEGPGAGRRQPHADEIGPVRVVVGDLELLPLVLLLVLVVVLLLVRPGRGPRRRSPRCRRSRRASSCRRGRPPRAARRGAPCRRRRGRAPRGRERRGGQPRRGGAPSAPPGPGPAPSPARRRRGSRPASPGGRRSDCRAGRRCRRRSGRAGRSRRCVEAWRDSTLPRREPPGPASSWSGPSGRPVRARPRRSRCR